jgi:SAM-dependent methyltransferase
MITNNKPIKSPITRGRAFFYCKKQNIDYYKCEDTGTLFTLEPLNQSGMVGGTGEDERNLAHNPARIERLIKLKSNPVVLDFGCGNGMFVNALKTANLNVFGYDPYNPDFAKLPEQKFDIVTMIEVIEHTYSPFKEVEVISGLLKKGGILYIESSFSDWVDEKHDYLNPTIGHSTVFSHQGLDILISRYDFRSLKHISRNVRIYERK